MAYTYARRQELARAKGFESYYQYRKVTEYADESTLFAQESGIEDPREDLDLAKLFYEAFVAGDPDDYHVYMRKGKIVVRYIDGKPSGAKAKLFIDHFGYVADAAEWAARYPNNNRFGHLLAPGTVTSKSKRKRSPKKGVRAKKLRTMRSKAQGTYKRKGG